ncbi:hypothetical protein Asppvi_007837 [Aspergillus pseudoviridinutans]|uniref:CCHC-type domain-containing protein n=1 Tax=Aspergillus pseudoviridinutans TaxID=1517512 RepID=A0A9P3BF41_9EURO|nr:uncharacterized protein Asppvi_007837 [Aspergillus pseudoviridinutans]GIJ88909.1 hypothetical protein Asppvi_007837 [Aspergillus pseudoviridinutans]
MARKHHTCYVCGQRGHMAWQCVQAGAAELVIRRRLAAQMPSGQPRGWRFPRNRRPFVATTTAPAFGSGILLQKNDDICRSAAAPTRQGQWPPGPPTPFLPPLFSPPPLGHRPSVVLHGLPPPPVGAKILCDFSMDTQSMRRVYLPRRGVGGPAYSGEYGEVLRQGRRDLRTSFSIATDAGDIPESASLLRALQQYDQDELSHIVTSLFPERVQVLGGTEHRTVAMLAQHLPRPKKALGAVFKASSSSPHHGWGALGQGELSMPTVPKDEQSRIDCVVKAAIPASPILPIPALNRRAHVRAAAPGSGPGLPG